MPDAVCADQLNGKKQSMKNVYSNYQILEIHCALAWSNVSFYFQEMSVEPTLNGHIVPEFSIEG